MNLSLRTSGPDHYVMAAMTWLPLFILFSMQGQAFAGQVTIPFLYDFTANVRFLITLLIFAETIVEPRLRHAVKHFGSSGLVPQTELPAFEEAIRKTNRLRDGVLPTVLLVIAAFAPSGSFACRCYPGGLPSMEMIRAALREAHGQAL